MEEEYIGRCTCESLSVVSSVNPDLMSVGLSASPVLLHLQDCLPIKQFLSVCQSIFQSNIALSIGLSASPAYSCLSARPGLPCPSIGLSANRTLFYVSSDRSVSPSLFCPVCLPVQLLFFSVRLPISPPIQNCDFQAMLDFTSTKENTAW